MLNNISGGRNSPLCESLESLEGVVDEDPVFVGLGLAVRLDRCSSWKNKHLSVQVKQLCEKGLVSLGLKILSSHQWWANLDQASKDLDKTIFRDLSPTPIP
jgi:hypothetical protein